MSEFKGTRGPWEYKQAQGDKYIATPMGFIMSSNYPYSQSINASEHDWRLIAAAPDLLEALIKVRDRIFPANQPERDQDKMWPLVNDAIAKALGETK